MPEFYSKLNLSVWNGLGLSAWKNATPNEQAFLAFCMAFAEVSGEPTQSESEYWDAALAAEAHIRAFLVENKFQIVKQIDFDLSALADGMHTRRDIRTLQANYGISLCGGVFESQTRSECERKYQKAVKIAERVAILGCSPQDNLPYFNAADHLASL